MLKKISRFVDRIRLSPSMRLGREHTRVGDAKLGLGHIAGGCLCSSVSVEVHSGERPVLKTELGNYILVWVAEAACCIWMPRDSQPQEINQRKKSFKVQNDLRDGGIAKGQGPFQKEDMLSALLLSDTE